MIRIDETTLNVAIDLNINTRGDCIISDGYSEIDLDRQQAAQLAEVLKRFAETGRLEE